MANYQIICSNEIEELAKVLQMSLFQEDANPFTRRTIVVSGPAMKRWVQRRLSDSLSVAAGLEIITLEGVLHHFSSLVGFAPTPSRLQLSLAIETEILNLLEKRSSLSEAECVFWQPIFNLFSGEEFPLKKRGERRLTALTEKLTYLFSQYALYGNGFMEGLDESWQKNLWFRLFREGGLATPQDEFHHFLETVSLAPRQNRHLHLFALSFLSPHHHRLFRAASAIEPVTLYQLSPCMTFWSDIRSDYENLALTRSLREKGASSSQQEALEQLLNDRNSMLANFGRLGRQTALFLEEQTHQFIEAYRPPKGAAQVDQYQELASEVLEPDESCLTALKGIHADLLYMREVEKGTRVTLSKNDISVQIHEAANPLREMQILYDRLMQIMDRNEGISPGDVLVMAPDISVYEPYIEMVFGAPESQLQRRVLGGALATTNKLAADFLNLISLSQSRFEAERVLEFFSQPNVRRCHSITFEELADLKRWIKRGKIRWGIDLFHRNETLLDQGCFSGMINSEAVGTWQHGMDRLLMDSIQAFDRDDPLSAVANSPSEGICSDTLDRWLKLFSALREDIKPLVDGTRLKLDEWTDYLVALSQGYLLGSRKETAALHDLFNRLKKGVTALTIEARFSFVTIKAWLEKWMEKELGGGIGNFMDEVRFASLAPKWFSPARVVVLIGMDEQSFPKSETKTGLNLMKGCKGCDYCPTSIDIDRYLFLEALLYAQDYFLLSFSTETLDGSVERGPSNLLCELMDYLQAAFEHLGGEDIWWTKHPYYPFDAAAFNDTLPLKRCYQREHYRAAMAYYGGSEVDQKPLINHRFVRSEKLEPIDIVSVVDIKDLVRLAKHPIHAYLSQTLGLYFDGEDEWGLSAEDDFSLSPLEHSRFRYQFLVKPFDRVVEGLKRQGVLPPGLFGAAALIRLEQQVSSWRAHLDLMGISPNDFFEVELRSSCEEIQRIHERLWIMPSISVEREDGTRVKIVGRLSDLTPKGLWVPAKSAAMAERIKYWPQYLLLSHLQPLMEKQLLLGGSGHVIEAGNGDELRHFVDYSFEVRRTPSLLMPEWVDAILSSDGSALEKKIRESISGKSGFTDEVIRRVFGGERGADVSTMITTWRPLAERLFGSLAERGGRKKC